MKHDIRGAFFVMFIAAFLMAVGCTPKGGGSVEKQLLEQIQKAGNEYKAGDFSEAKLSYLKALEQSKNDSQSLYGLGNIALFENRAEEAVDYYNKLIEAAPWYAKIWPLNVEPYYRLGQAYYRKDDFANAAKAFNKAAGPMQAGPFEALKGLKEIEKQLALFNGIKPYEIEGQQKTSIKFVVTDPLPVVMVSINGAKPEEFFLDTGAAEIVLDKKYAAEIGAKITGSMSSQYAGNKKSDTGLGMINTMVIGGITVKNLPVHTLDMTDIPSVLNGRPVKGAIGTRFLMHFLSTIDYKNGALILDSRVPGKKAEESRGIPFWLVDMHFILARGTVNGFGPFLLFVDTGLAGAGFTANENLLEKYGMKPDWSKAKYGAGGAGKVKGTELVVDKLTLGTGAMEIVETKVAGGAIEGGTPVVGDQLGFHVGGLISHQFFRKHALTLNFSDMKMLVE